MSWDGFKKRFDAWEEKTAQRLERALQSPRLLEPAGALLTVALKAKAARDKALTAWWSSFGLATRIDQERALHTLNQINSRLLDLEERLGDDDPKTER